MKRHFYLLVYDIADDKRRQKIAKLCESTSERVQKSVFEGYYSAKELDKIMKRAKGIMNEEEDSLRIYMLCEDCRSKVDMYGVGQITAPPGLVIV